MCVVGGAGGSGRVPKACTRIPALQADCLDCRDLRMHEERG